MKPKAQKNPDKSVHVDSQLHADLKKMAIAQNMKLYGLVDKIIRLGLSKME